MISISGVFIVLYFLCSLSTGAPVADASTSKILEIGKPGIFTGPASGVYLSCNAEEMKCVVTSKKEKSAKFIPRTQFKKGNDYYYQFQLKTDSEGEDDDDDKPLCLNNLGGIFGLGAGGTAVIDLYPCTKMRWLIGRNELFKIDTAKERVQSMNGFYVLYVGHGRPINAVIMADSMLGWQVMWGFTQDI